MRIALGTGATVPLARVGLLVAAVSCMQGFGGKIPRFFEALPKPQSHPPNGSAVSREVVQPANFPSRGIEVSET